MMLFAILLSLSVTQSVLASLVFSFISIPDTLANILPYDNTQVWPSTLLKRHGDQNTRHVTTTEQLLKQVYLTGFIPRMLQSVASLEQTMSSITRRLISRLKTNPQKLSNYLSLDSANLTMILDILDQSHLINLTLADILLNDSNRDIFAAQIGNIMVEQTWISMLISDILHGQGLSWDYLNHVITTTENRANSTRRITSSDPHELDESTRFVPKTNRVSSSKQPLQDPTSDQTPPNNERSNETDDLAAKFFRQLSLLIVKLQVAANGVHSFIFALNNSRILTPTIIQLLDSSAMSTVLSHIADEVYRLGVLDSYDLEHFLRNVRDQGLFSNFFQLALTHPIYGTAIKKFFLYWNEHGVYVGIEEGLFGPRLNQGQGENNSNTVPLPEFKSESWD